jgi:predicted nucleic acid-binding protein
MVYVDTSAPAKWYVNEARSEDFAAWVQQEAEPHISTLTAVEMRCLLARRRRNRELTPSRVARFRCVSGRRGARVMIQHRVDDKAVNGSLHLLEMLSEHPLRTLDALRLSIARQLASRLCGFCGLDFADWGTQSVSPPSCTLRAAARVSDHLPRSRRSRRESADSRRHVLPR